MLEHKNNWHWLWKISWPSGWMSSDSAAEATQAQFHQFKTSGTHYLTCSPQTCEYSDNTGANWQSSIFNGHQPLIRHVLNNKDTYFFATDDGIWRSTDMGTNISPFLLRGKNISYLASDANYLFAVIAHSEILQIDLNTHDAQKIQLPLIPAALLPTQVNLGRLTHDIHYARGIWGGQIDVWLQDISAISVLLLIISGLYMWLWRRNPAANKAQRFRFFLHLHRLFLGPLAIIALLYLCITGILLDHADDLRGAMRNITFTNNMLTPVYRDNRWQDKITSLAVQDNRLFIGTRFGVYEYSALGLEKGFTSYAWSMTSINDVIYVGGMGGPSAQYSHGRWQNLPKVPHMPSDITQSAQGLIWKSPHKTALSDGTSINLTMPQSDSVPLYFAVNALHSGMLFHKQWKWFNDVIAVLSLLSIFSGLWRLIHWLKFKLHKLMR
jgi:hypothetical protein